MALVSAGAARTVLALALLLAVLRGGASAQGAPTEAQVKAVFLYNFTKYVSWPAAAFESAAAPITLCVLGEDPFGASLDATLAGESVERRPLVARRIRRVEDAAGCHLLYVAESLEGEVGRVLEELSGKPVLTVSEVEAFAEKGGAIRLRKAGNKIHFDMNPGAAERGGLKMSSQLLKLGRLVGEERGG